MTGDTENHEIAAASQRAAGISALRKIRQLVDEENANEQLKERWIPRVIVIAGVLFVLLLAYFLVNKF